MNEYALAGIHQFAVLRNLVDLCERDVEARKLIEDADISLRFSVPKMQSLTLRFKRGMCSALINDKDKVDISLKFTGPKHLNQMIQNGKMPMITRGFTKVSFLQNDFVELTDRLQEFLEPTEEFLSETNEHRVINTYLTAYTAFYAIPWIAKYDEVGKHLVHKMKDGAIVIRVAGEPIISVVVKGDRMETFKGEVGKVMAYMDFSGLAVAGGILRGELDSFTCIGNGSLAISGSVYNIDIFNKFLNLVSVYLS